MLSISLGCAANFLTLPKHMQPPPPLPLKVVHDGDSISAASYGFPELWAADNPSVPFQNLAAGGSTLGDGTPGSGGTGSLWSRVLDLLAAEPSIITIMIGANDGLDGDAQTYFDRVMTYAAYLKAQRPGVKLLVCSNTPRDYGPGNEGQTAAYNTARRGLDALYRGAVGNQIDAYAPVAQHPALTDASALTSLFDSAHLHPSASCHSGYIHPVYAAALDALVDQRTGAAPDAFAFSDRANVAPNTQITGDPVIVSGLGSRNSAAVHASGGTASIGQGAFSSAPGTAMNGDAVSPRVTSSTANQTDASVEIAIGSVSDSFTASTVATNPISFQSLVAPAGPSASANDTTLDFTLPADGRCVIVTSKGSYASLTGLLIKTSDGASTLATGTALQRVGSSEHALWVFDNVLPAGDYQLVGTSNNPGTLTAYIGYLTNSTSGSASGSSRDNTFGYHNPGTLQLAAAVTVPAGGIGVLWAYSQNGYTDVGSNTTVQDFGDETGFYTFSATGDGLMNNLSGQAGMLGASFT